MKHRFYFAIILCVALGVVFHFSGSYFSEWMASSAHPSQQERLKRFYQLSIFFPLSIPSHPVPAFVFRFVPPNSDFPFNAFFGALFYFDIALLLRRIAICVRTGSVQPPSSLNRGWKVVLWACLILWLVGMLTILLPRFVQPFLGAEFASALGFGAGVVGAFIVPFFWVVPSNLFGSSFFVVELLSLRREGLFSLPNTSLQGTPASGRP